MNIFARFNTTFKSFKGDILWKQHFSWDLGCFGSLVFPHAYKLWKKSAWFFWVRYAFLKVPRLQLPNVRVSFGAPSYVGRGHSWILAPTSPLPSNQSIDKIIRTSGQGALSGGTRRSTSLSLPAAPPELPDCRRSFSGSPEDMEKNGIVLPELSCQAAAEFPPPELLVRWSTKS